MHNRFRKGQDLSATAALFAALAFSTMMAPMIATAAHHVLFILSWSPYSVHDFIHILMDLPIRIDHAMYVEGGPQAGLHWRTREGDRTLAGVCSEGLGGGADGPSWEVPNAIGVVRKGR